MRIVALTLAGLLAIILSRADETPQPPPEELTLSVVYGTIPDFNDRSKTEYRFVAVITNRSDHAILVPTRSFDGRPCCWSSGYNEKGVTYEVGFHRVGDFRIVPSPQQFFPVQLQPGQSTEFARYSLSMDSSVPLKSFEVTVYIQDEFAAPLGWWSGELRSKLEIPDIVSHPMPPF